MSTLYSLNTSDVVRGLVIAIFGAVLTFFVNLLSAPGFSILAIDWGEVLRIALLAGSSYLLKNFISDSQGALLGKYSL